MLALTLHFTTMLPPAMDLAVSVSKGCCDVTVDVCPFLFVVNPLKLILRQFYHLHSPGYYYTHDIFLYMKVDILGLCMVLVPGMMSSAESLIVHLHAHHTTVEGMMVQGLMSCRIFWGSEPFGICRKFKTDPISYLFKSNWSPPQWEDKNLL